jgi:hypothetical protein
MKLSKFYHAFALLYLKVTIGIIFGLFPVGSLEICGAS